MNSKKILIPVNIGSDIIDSTTVRQYKNVMMPVLEAITNSFEEGASIVEIITAPKCPRDRFTIMDNGSGMDEIKAQAFCSFYRSIKPKGSIGQFNLGSKFWAGLGQRAIIKTSPYQETNSTMLKFEVMREMFFKKSCHNWVFEGEWLKRDKNVPPQGSFTIIEVQGIFKDLHEDKLIKTLPELMPVSRQFKVYVNDKEIAPRSYKGSLFTLKVSKKLRDRELAASFEIFLINAPTEFDTVRLMAKGRKIVDMVQLKNELSIPSVYFETGLAGYITCDALNECVTTSRGDIDIDHPIAIALAEILWETAPQLQELLNKKIAAEENKDFDKMNREVAQEYAKKLQENDAIRDMLDIEQKPQCLVCNQTTGMRRCPALQFTKICFKCCYKSWGSIDERISGCSEECRHFGKKIEHGGGGKRDVDIDGSRRIPAIIRFHGRSLKIETTDLHTVPTRLNRASETIIINSAHPLFKKYYDTRGMKQTWKEWIKLNVAIRVGEYLDYPISDEGLIFALKLMDV